MRIGTVAQVPFEERETFGQREAPTIDNLNTVFWLQSLQSVTKT